MWLLSQTMPEALRPDRCGVVFNPDPEVVSVRRNARPDEPAYDIAVLEAYLVHDVAERRHDEGRPVMADPLVQRVMDQLVAKPGCGVVWRMGPDLEGRRYSIVVFRDLDGKMSHIPAVYEDEDAGPLTRTSREERSQRAAAILQGVS